MTEPPSPTWDPNAAGNGPAQDPQTQQPGFIPPQQQPPGYEQGGYQQGPYQQGGYPPPMYSGPPAPPPPGYPTADDKTMALVSHFGGAGGMFISGFLGWLAPLIVLVTKGNQSPTARAHAVAALNFQLTWTIVSVIGYITLCVLVGWFILVAAWLVGVIFGIIAGLRANEGQLYKYPLSIQMIK